MRLLEAFLGYIYLKNRILIYPLSDATLFFHKANWYYQFINTSIFYFKQIICQFINKYLI